MRQSDLSGKPRYVREEPEYFGNPDGVREAQLRTLMSVDDMIARTFEVIRNLEEGQRTLAIFISDNGMLWGEFGMTGKTHAYTPSIKVPMMMLWPGHTRGGKTDRRLVTNVDVGTTILRAAGRPTKSTDGRSLLSDKARWKLLLEYWYGKPFPTPRWNSIRTKRYQYVEYYARDGKREFREYYNLRRDPWQLHNLLRDGTKRNDPDVRRLSKMLRSMTTCKGRACP